MEVTDPNTGVPVMVRMRRDLPGYNVTRARRNSPRLRWSLPVNIEWQSECVLKFLGQSCACCDLLSGPQDDGKATNIAIKPPIGQPGGFSGGHEKVIVDSKVSKVSKSNVGPERNGKLLESVLSNRRKPLISTSDKPIAKPPSQGAKLTEVTNNLTHFDVMQSNLRTSLGGHTELGAASHAILSDIAEEDGESGSVDVKEES